MSITRGYFLHGKAYWAVPILPLGEKWGILWMRSHVHALIHCDFRETPCCFCMSNLFLTFPAHHSKKYSEVKHFFSKQSLQPHESTSAISYEPEEVYPIPKRKARVHTRRKAKHLPQQEFPNPKSVPRHNFPLFSHPPPLQFDPRPLGIVPTISLPSLSSPIEPLSALPQPSPRNIQQQLPNPRQDPVPPFSHPPLWQRGRRHRPRNLRIKSMPSPNKPLSTLPQQTSHPHPPSLPSPEYEKSVEHTGTPLPSSESEDESVEYTGTAFTYDSPNGISLHFPTVAECEAAIKISIKVVNDDYILPEGYKDMDLVSSMFKITASADLPAPVTVRMEHCAIVKEGSYLKHMIAHSPPPYKFKPLEGGKFPIRECYGEFHTKAFSIFTTLARKLGLRLSLSVQVFYHSRNRVVFVVTKNLRSQISAVEHKYATATKALEQTMSCSCSTNAIILTMPQPKKPGGWLVESDFEPAQIETRDILEYTAGMTPPSVYLRMRWTGEGNPVEDSVRIAIRGASAKSFFLLCKPDHDDSVADSGSSSLHSQNNPTLSQTDPSPSTPSTEPASPLSLQATSPATSDTYTSTEPSTSQHRHNSSLSPSVESIALRRSNAIFTRAGDPDGLVTVLYSNFLLTPDEKIRALQHSLTARQKMEEIFQTMERRVSVNPSDFHTLLTVLKAEPATKALGEEMQGQ